MSRPTAALAALLLMAVPLAAHANAGPLQSAIGNPDNLKVSGSFRLRYEALEGQPRAGLNPTDEQLSVRTIIALEYRNGPLRIGGELHDSRAWLGKAGSSISANDVNALEPVQAYIGADIVAPFGRGSKASILAGRFTFNLGSRRFVSSDDYRNATSGYTGLRVDLKAPGGAAATLFYTMPLLRLPDDLASVLDNRAGLDKESFDLRLWGGLLTLAGLPGGVTYEAGFYGLDERDSPGRPTRDRSLRTVSSRVFREPKAGRFDFEVEGAWQSGNIRSGNAANAALLDVSAGSIHAHTGYLFAGPAKLRAALAYDYVSGDKPGGSFNRFDTLFGGRRFEYGPGGIFSAIGRANISTPSVRIEAAPGQRFDVMAVYRAMWLASRFDSFSNTGVRDNLGNAGRFAGHMVEGRMRYWLVPGLLRSELNFALIAKGSFFDRATNAPQTGNARYVSGALTAQF